MAQQEPGGLDGQRVARRHLVRSDCSVGANCRHDFLGEPSSRRPVLRGVWIGAWTRSRATTVPTVLGQVALVRMRGLRHAPAWTKSRSCELARFGGTSAAVSIWAGDFELGGGQPKVWAEISNTAKSALVRLTSRPAGTSDGPPNLHCSPTCQRISKPTMAGRFAFIVSRTRNSSPTPTTRNSNFFTGI